MNGSREVRAIVAYLAVGASTDASLRAFVGGGDAAFVRAMEWLQAEKRIVRGVWGALSVWRLIRSGDSLASDS